jgi:Ca2+-transporting ATPase
LLDGPSLRFILLSGTIKGLLTLGLLGLVPCFHYSLDTARTVAFQVLAVGQLFFVYPARHTWLRPRRNPFLHLVVAVGVLLQFAVGCLPITVQALDLEYLPPALWATILGTALLAWALAEITNRILFRGAAAGRK